MSFIIIYVTHENEVEAKKIASILLDEKLITCVNYFPISSSFWWNGSIDSGKEIVSLLKTRDDNWDVVKNEF